MDGLKNSTVLVTGGGQGLGAETCHLLAASGAQIACVDIRPDAADAVAGKIAEEGGQAIAIHADISHYEGAAQAVAHALRVYGQVDVLINNAAVDVTLPVEELGLDDWTRIINTNLNGPYWLSHIVFPLMKQRRSGQVVNVASTAAKRAWANASAYHASKWGLLGLSHALHVEGRPHGIRVTAVAAGGMRTPFLLDRFPDINVDTLQDPRNVAKTILFVLTLPQETVIPEVMVLPMSETSWP